MAGAIRAMWFYDLRAKAADDTADEHGDQAAADLLGHDNVSTTQRHYLRRRRAKKWGQPVKFLLRKRHPDNVFNGLNH